MKKIFFITALLAVSVAVPPQAEASTGSEVGRYSVVSVLIYHTDTPQNAL